MARESTLRVSWIHVTPRTVHLSPVSIDFRSFRGISNGYSKSLAQTAAKERSFFSLQRVVAPFAKLWSLRLATGEYTARCVTGHLYAAGCKKMINYAVKN